MSEFGKHIVQFLLGGAAGTRTDVDDDQNTLPVLAHWDDGGTITPVSDTDELPTSNVTIGTVSDAAVVTDANGTLSAKLRGIIKLLVDKIFVKLHDGTNALSFILHEGVVSVPVSIAHIEQFVVHVDVDNIGAVTGVMLIDLSDTTNWPHTNTGHIVIDEMSLDIDPATAYRGDIEFGFLSSVDDTNGDLNVIMTHHFGQGAMHLSASHDFEGGIDLEAEMWFGPTTADDVTWQTDVNLLGPDGTTAFPAGDEDFVMKVNRTAGNVDIGVTILYETKS